MASNRKRAEAILAANAPRPLPAEAFARYLDDAERRALRRAARDRYGPVSVEELRRLARRGRQVTAAERKAAEIEASFCRKLMAQDELRRIDLNQYERNRVWHWLYDHMQEAERRARAMGETKR